MAVWIVRSLCRTFLKHMIWTDIFTPCLNISPLKTIIANSDYIGKEYADWTYEDLYRFYEDRPEGMYLFGREYENTFNEFCLYDLDPWIDHDNNTCKFGTPEFIKFLNFCKETKDSYISR